MFGKSKNPTYRCTCGHPLSMHEPKQDGTFGGCNAEHRTTTDEQGMHFRDCRCLGYIGELPPESYLALIRRPS